MKKLLVTLAMAALAPLAAMLGMAGSAHAAESVLECSSGYSGVATTVTSCAFAGNVRSAWIASGGASVINAYSPTTGQVYTMQCGTGFGIHLSNGMSVDAVRCVGGNDAVVWIW
jgi:hypothetical protein